MGKTAQVSLKHQGFICNLKLLNPDFEYRYFDDQQLESFIDTEYPEYRNVKAWRGIGNGRIQLDPAKRLPIYQAAQRELLLNPVQIPLVAIKKYQVVRKRVQGMYVAFSDFNSGLRTVWLNG
jgi:ABC-type oligopeptide transport system substrate-binding subunit